MLSSSINTIKKQIQIVEFNIKKLSNQRYCDGYIFFIPLKSEKERVPYLKGKFQHVGIIVNNYIYETFNYELYCIHLVNERMSKLLKYNPIFIPMKNIDTWKIYDNIFSGTCCDEFVARSIGLSNLKGVNKGNFFPEDIYNIIFKKT